MSNRQMSFLKKLDYKKWGFGLKLNLLVYVILIVSFVVVGIIGLSLLRSHLYTNSFDMLEQLSYQTKKNVESDYNEFIQEINKLLSDDLAYTVQELNAAFNSYSAEMSDRFQYDSIAQSKLLLTDYYESEILENIKWNTPLLDEVFPQRDIEIVMQHIYLADNKWDYGEKDKLFNSKTGSSYARNHETLHTSARSFARKYHLNNLYLISPEQGDVIYNLNKNITFGTNLFSGNFKNSELAKIFQQASSSSSMKDEIYFSDYAPFVAEENKPVAYIAKRLTMYNDVVAVVVIELGAEFLESMVFDFWLEENSEAIALNIIGKDNKYRLNEIGQYKDSDVYFSQLRKKGIRNEKLMQAAMLEGGAMVLGIEEVDLKGKKGFSFAKDDLGQDLLYLSLPLRLNGFEWSVLGTTKVDYHESKIAAVRVRIIFVLAALLLLATFALRGFISSIIQRLNKLRSSFDKLTVGEVVEDLVSESEDELGTTMTVFNSLNTRIKEVSNLAINLSEGEYETNFSSTSDTDILAGALNTLKDSLKRNSDELVEREIEDIKAKWTNEGIAKFNDLLRQSNNDIRELAYIIIENMVSYLGMIQGGVFLVEGESEASKKIELLAAYAYDRRKYNKKTIEIGEGLIGNCYLEKKSIHLDNIPEGYLELTSGLGSAVPRTLYIVPLMMDKEVLGFVEMASLSELEGYHVEFIEKLADNIAATFETVKLNTRTAELLEESKRRANEITQQEEEMRQNMEEMLATQEELARLREEDEKRQKELQEKINYTSGNLQSLLDTIKAEVIVKDSDGVIVMANRQACMRYNLSNDEIKGKADIEVLDKTIIESEKELDQTTINDGEYIGYRSENVEGSLVEYTIEKRVFQIVGRSEPGVITFWKKEDRRD